MQAGVDPPFQVRHFGAVFVGRPDVGIAGSIEQLARHCAAVSGNAHLSVIILADILPVQQHVDDGFRQLKPHPGGRAIGQVAAQHQSHIAIAQPVQRRVPAPDAVAQRHTQGQGMAFRENAFSPVAGYDGRAQPLRQGNYVISAAGGMDFLPEENYRTPGAAEQIPGAFHLQRIALRHASIAGL